MVPRQYRITCEVARPGQHCTGMGRRHSWVVLDIPEKAQLPGQICEAAVAQTIVGLEPLG